LEDGSQREVFCEAKRLERGAADREEVVIKRTEGLLSHEIEWSEDSSSPVIEEMSHEKSIAMS
jgi:hypothetical protein